MRVDRRASAPARLVVAAKRKHLRTLSGQHAQFFTPRALARIAELERETPAEPLTYTITAIATLFGIPERAVLANVKRGTIPPADRVVAGSPRWLATSIDPILTRLGRMPLEERLQADCRQASRDGAAMTKASSARRLPDAE